MVYSNSRTATPTQSNSSTLQQWEVRGHLWIGPIPPILVSCYTTGNSLISDQDGEEEGTMELQATLVMDQSHVEKKSAYRSSWINRLTRWIDAQPGPAWCYYLALLLLIVGVQLGAAWWES